MSEYTPETNAVRDFYADHRAPTYPWTRIGADEIAAVESAQAEWDRWYARERARWQAEAAEEATQRLARAAFAVDSKHHFHEGKDARPTCLCGFVGSARKRTQTEHITAAVIEEYDHD